MLSKGCSRKGPARTALVGAALASADSQRERTMFDSAEDAPVPIELRALTTNR